MHPSTDASPCAGAFSPSSTKVDFIIIGAQKCGTTSLFEYMRPHPQVYMPPQKEIGFFSSDVNYARGLDAYASTMALDTAPAGAVCGEASVAYMGGTPDQRTGRNGSSASMPPAPGDGCVREAVIPERIKAHAPDVRLVCILRDPVARCLSHYRMAVLAHREARSFDQAIADMLRSGALEDARSSITGNNGYIVRGEYFRILSGYWRTFPREQLMVLFSSDLDSRPAEVLARVFAFIGVRSDFIPDNLGVRYRQAAVERRIRGLDLYAWESRLRRSPAAAAVWQAVPSRGRARFGRLYEQASFRVDMWNARRGIENDAVPAEVRESLVSHFRPDSEALASELGVEVPWLADWDDAA